MNPELAVTQHSYDALNRLKQTLDALSGPTDYTYDAHDNVTSVSSPNVASHTYEYDNLEISPRKSARIAARRRIHTMPPVT